MIIKHETINQKRKIITCITRLILERKHLEEHKAINNDLFKACGSKEMNGLQKHFMEYVGLTDSLKPHRENHIEILDLQLKELMKFHVIYIYIYKRISLN